MRYFLLLDSWHGRALTSFTTFVSRHCPFLGLSVCLSRVCSIVDRRRPITAYSDNDWFSACPGHTGGRPRPSTWKPNLSFWRKRLWRLRWTWRWRSNLSSTYSGSKIARQSATGILLGTEMHYLEGAVMQELRNGLTDRPTQWDTLCQFGKETLCHIVCFSLRNTDA